MTFITQPQELLLCEGEVKKKLVDVGGWLMMTDMGVMME